MYSAFQLTIIHGQSVHAMLTPAVTMQEPGTPLVVISFSPGPYSPATPCFHMPQRPCTPSRDSLPAEPRTAVTRRGCGGWDPYAELLAYGMAMAYAARGRALAESQDAAGPGMSALSLQKYVVLGPLLLLHSQCKHTGARELSISISRLAMAWVFLFCTGKPS